MKQPLVVESVGEAPSIDEILGSIDVLEKKQIYHQEQAAEYGKQLATLRDRLNGRARNARTGKFARPRKKAGDQPGSQTITTQGVRVSTRPDPPNSDINLDPGGDPL